MNSRKIKNFLFLFISLFIGATSNAQNYIGKKKHINQILQQTKLFSKYLVAGDTDKLVACYTADGKIFPSDTDIIQGSTALYNFWKTSKESRLIKHKVTPVEIKVVKETAFDFGYYQGTTLTSKGKEISWKGKYVILWKRIDKKLLNRPMKLSFFKDVEDPYYNQLFYNLYFEYNYYDGIILGPELYNQAAIKKKWLFHVTPKYGFKSKTITGSGSFAFQHLPENSSIYRYRAGFAASNSHYNNELTYNKITPFIQVDFKRKSLRDVGGRSAMARYVIVDKELPLEDVNPEEFKYKVFNIRYSFSKPNIIKDLRYFADFQYGHDFSKLSFDIRYRKLTDRYRQLDFRMFFGSFIFNHTNSDFFSFALDRPNDYMFDLNYLGRSEDSGLFSQQIIIAEGGFKSIFEHQFSNQWIFTTNASIGIWRWFEIYADVGLVKNKNTNTLFKYDSGIRLNFIHNFLEFYFPIQSSLGFEPDMPNYASKIRFVFTLNPSRIYNFIRRGFY